MWLSFQVGDDYLRRPEVVSVFLIVVAGLMVSRVPTFAFKKFKVPHGWILPTMLFVGLFAASLVSVPWLTVSICIFVYMILIPFSMRSYRTLSRKADELKNRTEPAETAVAVAGPPDDPE